MSLYTKNMTIATVLKLANVLSSLMLHSSNHPCTWCDVQKKNLDLAGNLRTVSNTKEKYRNWINRSAKFSNAKKFGNVINLPIFNIYIQPKKQNL